MTDYIWKFWEEGLPKPKFLVISHWGMHWKVFCQNLCRQQYDSSFEKKKSKIVQNRRTITHSKASNSSFLDCQCSSTCTFSDAV